MSKSLNNNYCLEQVRQNDRDRYLTALFAPADHRQDLFALYAFNHEVAKISTIVSEAMLGHIRLQWWREVIDDIYDGTPRKYQIVEALSHAVDRHNLPREPFDALISGRETDLAEERLETLPSWLDYAEATSSNLTSLSLCVLGVPDGPAHQAGYHVGIAWSLTGHLRAAPARAALNQTYLPEELRDDSGMKRRVVSVAHEHLWAARRLRRQVPKAALPALLPAVLASRYLHRLSFEGGDLKGASPLDQLALYGNAFRGRY